MIRQCRIQDAIHPPGEMDNPFERRESPLGYLDYLTWSNNRVQLIPTGTADSVVVREAVVVPADQAGSTCEKSTKTLCAKREERRSLLLLSLLQRGQSPVARL